MSQWRRKEVPPICERMIGFSVPHEDRILVVSYEGTHLLQLGTDITVEHDSKYTEYDIYDPDSGIARYHDVAYTIIGLCGGRPLLDSPQGESLVMNTNTEILSIIRSNKTIETIPYENFSGDWAAATFSPDGMWIALGCPYDFDFILLERE